MLFYIRGHINNYLIRPCKHTVFLYIPPFQIRHLAVNIPFGKKRNIKNVTLFINY